MYHSAVIATLLLLLLAVFAPSSAAISGHTSSEPSAVKADAAVAEDVANDVDAGDMKSALTKLDSLPPAQHRAVLFHIVAKQHSDVTRLNQTVSELMKGAGGAGGAGAGAGGAGRGGSDGSDGSDGTDGQDGPRGRSGSKGINGTAGRDGRDGHKGFNGTVGLDGHPGRDGRMTCVATVTYNGTKESISSICPTASSSSTACSENVGKVNRGLLDKWFDTNEEDGIPKGRGAEYPQIRPDVPMYMLYSQVNMRERFGTARDWWAHPFHFVWAQYCGAGDSVDDATGLGGWA